MSAFASSQSIAHINTVLGIGDSLQQMEVRVYKRYSTSNATDILRIYYTKKTGYVVEGFEYRHPGTFDKVIVSTSSDLEYVYMKLIATNILFLPAEEVFQYKKDTPVVVFDDGKYAYSITSISVSDGVSYTVHVKNNTKYNYIEYDNPESYLQRYPGIDELEYFVQFLNVIRDEFGFLEKG